MISSSVNILDRADEGHRCVTSLFFDVLCLGSQRFICALSGIFMEWTGIYERPQKTESIKLEVLREYNYLCLLCKKGIFIPLVKDPLSPFFWNTLQVVALRETEFSLLEIKTLPNANCTCMTRPSTITPVFLLWCGSEHLNLDFH